MNHLEIEYKTLLDKEEYQSLLPLFADTELVVQTNHYIDTPDQLIRKEKMVKTSAQKKPRRSFNTNSCLTEKSKIS